METNKFNDPFQLGRWSEWLRGFEEGEQQIRKVTEDQMKSIRVTISKNVKLDYYFKTVVSGGELCITRISLQEWLKQPKRKIM